MSSLYVVCDTDLVSVVMNVIRMIKLFGWEPRIAAQINEKREEELVAVKRNRMYGLANQLCKYVCCTDWY